MGIIIVVNINQYGITFTKHLDINLYSIFTIFHVGIFHTAETTLSIILIITKK